MTPHNVRPRSSRPPRNLCVVESIARRNLVRGVVCYALLDFDDIAGFKGRPVVIVDCMAHDALVMRVTTSRRASRRNDHIEIRDLTAAGLDRASWADVRPRLIERRSIEVVLGHLGRWDLDRLFTP